MFGLLLAATETAEASGGIIAKGGVFMIPLILCSLVALALIADRIYHLYVKFALNHERLVEDVSVRIDANDYRGAIQEVEAKGDHPLAEVVRAGLMKSNKSDREIQRSMEEAMVKHQPKLTKRTNYLAMIANVATLMGLLGTIQGLIQCFAGVADASAAEKQAVLANGISVAMFTTFSGLIVAIPCLIAYTVLHNKELALVNNVEEAAITVFNRISGRNREMVAGKMNGQERPSQTANRSGRVFRARA